MEQPKAPHASASRPERRGRAQAAGYRAFLVSAALAPLVQCADFAPDGPIDGAGGNAEGGSRSMSSGGASGANEGGNSEPESGAGGGNEGGTSALPSGTGGEHSFAGAGTAGMSSDGASGGEGGEHSTPLRLRAERSVIETNPDALRYITLERVLARVQSNSASVAELYLNLVQSFGARDQYGTNERPHCDDESPLEPVPLTMAEAEAGVPATASTLNGFKVACPTEASSLEAQLPAWRPLALVNRFDLAPIQGENCGEQHLSFYYLKNFGGQPTSPTRAYLRFAAVVENPRPELGLEGCRPIADYWASLSDEKYDSPEERALAHGAAFLGGAGTTDARPEQRALSRAGLEPFVSPRYFGERGRLQWLFLGNYGIWRFFEHAFVASAAGGVVRRPLTQSFFPASLLEENDKRERCTTELLRNIPTLLGANLSELGMDLDPACFAGAASTADQRLSDGLDSSLGLELTQKIEDAVHGYDPLSLIGAKAVAARADFVGTCRGCHEMPDSPLFDPNSLAHVSEDVLERCGPSGEDATRRCYARSPLLATALLPHWLATLDDYWIHPGTFVRSSSEDSTVSLGGVPIPRVSP